MTLERKRPLVLEHYFDDTGCQIHAWLGYPGGQRLGFGAALVEDIGLGQARLFRAALANLKADLRSRW